MNKRYNLISIAILSCILIIGCNKTPSFADLCKNHPKICAEFEKDSWCKSERIAVGFANLAYQKSLKDIQQHNQLISYENYAKCMGNASKIEHIKYKEKQSMRIANVKKAKKRIKEISDNTVNSNHPSLLYYHWTHHLNKNALQNFLALEGTQQLETPTFQLNLATYYAKKDQNKTLHLLYRALELTGIDDPINTEIFKSIATIFADKKKHKQVYIWSKILKIHSPDDDSIKRVNLDEYAKSFQLEREFLDSIASKTLETILKGKFQKP